MPESSSTPPASLAGLSPSPAEPSSRDRRDAAATALFALADVAPPAAPALAAVHASPRVTVPLMATKLPMQPLASAPAGAPRHALPRAAVSARPSSSALGPAAAAAKLAAPAGRGHAPAVPVVPVASSAGRAIDAPPRPALPDMKPPQEKLVLQTVWSASGAAVSAASGLLAFTGGRAGQPAAQTQPMVRDFWSTAAAPSPAASASAAAAPSSGRPINWKRTSVWENDVEGQARRAAAQPPPKKCRWKRVVAMAGHNN